VVTLIGKKEGCKLRLSHPAVCPVHLAIVYAGSGYYAVDMVTRHGTMLNHLKLRLEELHDGDLLTVGPWSMAVGVAAPGGDAAGDDVLGLDSAPVGVMLEVVGTQERFEPRRAVSLIGRDAECDFVLADTSVSRIHAMCFVHEGRPVLCDLLSTNGLLVGGAPTNFHPLADGDVITIGATDVIARISAAGDAIHPPGNGKAARPSVDIAAPAPGDDLIDIRATEGSQRWQIVDHLERAKRKK
jgi:pSer/pThr/pTyr-binding forkhead associated (FHA) protein